MLSENSEKAVINVGCNKANEVAHKTVTLQYGRIWNESLNSKPPGIDSEAARIV